MSNRPRTTKRHPRAILVQPVVPYDQWLGLQRFEGATDADKMLTILRIANRHIDKATAVYDGGKIKHDMPIEK